jgi:lipopolysaccharide/colanic/teichoic acid biosynthesis glycosyltransferase
MYKNIKRILDISFSLLLLFLLSPIFLIVSFLILLESKGKGPIFFKQKRIGANMKVFNIIKFRTMLKNSEIKGFKVIADDNRVTKVGRFIRKFSIDELPQIINIIKGDMSFIGPRPPLTYYPYQLDNYPLEFRNRFLVLPGISGLAQVNGRKELEWEKRIQFDLMYVNNVSFFLDLKIFFITLKQILFPVGNL